MGLECIDPEFEQSVSFARTAALLNAAQFMTQDMTCVGAGETGETGGGAGISCQVFGGTHNWCKVAVGGAQDCCDVPTGTSVGDYIAAMYQAQKLDAAIMSIKNESSIIKGTYQTFREPIVKTVSNVTKPFVSFGENISGAVQEFFQPVELVYDEVKNQLTQAVTEIYNTIFQSASPSVTGAVSAGVSETVQDSAGDFLGQLTGAATFVMNVYTVYVVAMMAIEMIYECEEQEFELAAKRDINSCTHLGSYCAGEALGACIEKRESYCCFNSPLSRIINEQARPQLGRPYGDIENPDCGGLSIEEVTAIDWSLIDLGEWTALLTDNNLAPNQYIDIASLTGAGHDLEVFGEARPDAVERTEQRFGTIDIDSIRREAAGNFSANTEGEACTEEDCDLGCDESEEGCE